MTKTKLSIVSFLTLLLLLIGLWAVGQFYLSKKSENTFKELIALVDLGPGIQVELLSYESGFTKSQAKTQVTLVDKVYQVEHEIFTGPVIFKTGKSFTKGFPLRFALMHIENHLESPLLPTPIDWTIILPYFGKAKIFTKGKPFEYAEDNMLIRSAGWEGEGWIARNFKAYQFQYNLPQTEMLDKLTVGQAIDVKVKNFLTSMEQTGTAEESKIKLHYQIEQVQHGQTQGQVNQVKAECELNSSNGILNIILNANIGNLMIGAYQMGPFNLNMELKNLDKTQVEALYEDFKKKGKMQKEFLVEEQGILKKLLSKKIQLILRGLSVTLPQGMLVAKADVTIGDESFNTAKELNKDILFNNTTGEVALTVSKDLFEDLLHLVVVPALKNSASYQTLKTEEEKRNAENAAIHSFMDSLIASNILIIHENSYELKGNLQNGKWVVSPSTLLSQSH